MENAQLLPLPVYMRFLAGPLSGKIYRIATPDILVGRDPSCDIVVPDLALAPQHIQLTWNDWHWHIKKLSAQSHFTVNNHEGHQGTIKHGDVIHLGNTISFVLHLEADRTTRPLGGWHPEEGAGRLSPHEERLPVAAGDLHPCGIPFLEITDDNGVQRNFPLNKPSISIGRHLANDIVINHLTVSDFHLLLVKEGDDYICCHPHPLRENTLNGFLHGTKYYSGNEQVRIALKHGSILRIYTQHGLYIELVYSDGSGLLARTDRAKPKQSLISLDAPLITVGRASDNMVVLDDLKVSSHHARLEQREEGYQIVDLRSTNHTLVNGWPIFRHRLEEGDIVQISWYKFEYTGTHLILVE